jgi:hypothetical protein
MLPRGLEPRTFPPQGKIISDLTMGAEYFVLFLIHFLNSKTISI